tara:strand:+ start:550 stop:771 length:222 start_codon:yes stop_codon:yes gene_type:complete
MYLISFDLREHRPVERIEGSFPSEYLHKLWFEYNLRFIVISTYSNTIKTPVIYNDYGEEYLEFTDFNLPSLKS